MPATSDSEKPSLSERWFAFRNKKLADPGFQRWASAFSPTRVLAARRTKSLFDISAGFVYSQVLLACVRLKLFEALAGGPVAPDKLAADVGLPQAATDRLVTMATGLKLLEKRPDGRIGLGVHGAACLGNPAIGAMVEHHALLYRDLEDPVALLRGDKQDTALAAFWPYAQSGRPGTNDPDAVAPYSALMTTSQALIADDVLDVHPLTERGTLLDVGGGEGAFLVAVARRRPDLKLILFDLPAVAERASDYFKRERLAATTVGGDFKTDALPAGVDVVSLIRVVHDHDDASVKALLGKVFDALHPGGILLLAEPFAETAGAESVGAYFAMYLLAMGQGTPRTEQQLTTLLYEAGFARVRAVATRRPALTSLIVAQKSAGRANRTVSLG